jgi:hypothetical protein
MNIEAKKMKSVGYDTFTTGNVEHVGDFGKKAYWMGSHKVHTTSKYAYLLWAGNEGGAFVHKVYRISLADYKANEEQVNSFKWDFVPEPYNMKGEGVICEPQYA